LKKLVIYIDSVPVKKNKNFFLKSRASGKFSSYHAGLTACTGAGAIPVFFLRGFLLELAQAACYKSDVTVGVGYDHLGHAAAEQLLIIHV